MSDALATSLKAAESELAGLDLAKTVAAKPPTIQMIEIRQIIMQLEANLKSDPVQARELLRNLLGKIVIRREGKAIFAEFSEPRAQLLAAVAGESYLELVAGARFVPQLRRIRIQ